MEFIKQMKKREFIEMGLKTLAAILAAFLAIILMEGMIYSIHLNALKNDNGHTSYNQSTVAYCIKEAEDKYFVIYYNEGLKDENGKLDEWAATKNQYKTKAECLAMEGSTVKEVIMHAPNAFELAITPIHYVVMALFVAAVAGFFTYKFIALAKEYNGIEAEFKKTGTIALG